MNILISGMTCSGKTTLAHDINLTSREHALSISQDYYFKDKDKLPRNEKNYFLFDSPTAFNTEEFKSDVSKLFKTGFINYPKYDVSKNKRTGYSVSIPCQEINIFEGLHTIDLLDDVVDEPLKIYMDTNVDECLRRRIKRDIKYGMSEKEIEVYFYEVMLDQYEEYIKPQINNADIIVRNNDDKAKVLKMFRR